LADRSTRENLSECIVKQLQKYLKNEVRELRQVIDEWPNENYKLTMPSVSIITTSTEFRPELTYQSLTGTITNHKAKDLYCVGFYDVKLQLDVWAKTKEERNDIFDLLFIALNKNISPMGLSLQLEDYYNQWCQYLLVGHNIADSEERNQRNEWRVTIDLLVNCKAIMERTDSIMTNVDQDEYDVSETVTIPD